jgi:hypothetical protein
MLSGIIVLSITQNVFLTKLVGYPAMGTAIRLEGNTGHRCAGTSDSADQRDQVLADYNRALLDVFYKSLGLSCLAVVSTLGVECRLIKQRDEK